VVRRKEWDARSAGQPTCSIACPGRSPARAGSVLGSVAGLRVSSARMGWVEPAGGFWTAGMLWRGKVYAARPSESERGVTLRGRGNQCMHQVGRTWIRETHLYTLIAASCTLRPALAVTAATHPNSILLHSTPLRWQPSPPFQASLCDAVQAVVAVKVRLRVARRYAHSMHLRNGMGWVVSVEVPVASS
jgi:hypothetical protein